MRRAQRDLREERREYRRALRFGGPAAPSGASVAISATLGGTCGTPAAISETSVAAGATSCPLAGGSTKSNIVRFPASRRMPATTIPRDEFERLAELALDLVERTVALLDEQDGDSDAEEGGDAEPSLAAPIGGPCQLVWAAGGDQDLERL